MEGLQALGQEILDPTSSKGISAQLLQQKSFTGVAGSGGATSITLVADTANGTAIEGLYDGWTVRLIGGTGAGQERKITGYVGSTRVATVATWGTNPDNTSHYIMLPPVEGIQAQGAVITVETEAINYCVNGSVPTVSTDTNIGQYADVDSEAIELCGPNEVRNFRCIARVGSNGAKVKVVTFG